ncbi:MAG TPA: DNRLRE domain-containing protein [Polyangiaceae bacterium]|nr:DNRLRE domain-containing protein [Polyangiaceae bacterium]
MQIGEAREALTTYQVGPGKQYASLQAVASLLKPGDVVEVAGGTTYTGGLRFTNAGTPSAKITIRGISVNGARPKISGGTSTVEFAGNDYVFDNFEITGGTSRCVFHHANDITIRNTSIHDCAAHGLLGADEDSGSLTLEFSEVYRCGSGTNLHQIYMATDETAYPGSVFRMQHCYVHDGLGGNNVKSRAERNEIYYNWVEGAYYHELELIGPDGQDEDLAREDSDVVGNVLYQGYTDRTHFAIRVGGDGTGETWGRYRFLGNTIVMGNASTSAVFRMFDGIESVEMHDNALFRLGGGPVTVFRDAEATWKSGQVIGGTKNWVTSGSVSIPTQWTSTATGTSAGFVDVTGKNVHLASTSPLVNLGVSSTSSPSGHPFPNPLAVPAYEPPLHTVLTAATPRTIVSAIDVGAYELASGSTSPTPPPTSTTPTPPPTSTTPTPPPTPPPSTGATTTLLPVADAYVEEYDAAAQNFGAATVLFAATNATHWYDDDTYLKFSVTNAAKVTAAKLRVTAALTSTSEGAITLAVYPVSDTTWTESGLNWNDKPARGTSPLASTSVTSGSYVTYEVDVTSYVAAQRAAGSSLVSFALHDPTATNARILMQSKEGGSAPALVVTQ